MSDPIAPHRKLRIITIGVILLTFMALALGQWLSARWLYAGSFEAAERREALQVSHHAYAIFNDTVRQLERSATDNGTWDEIYDYMQGRAPLHLDNVFSQETYRALWLSGFAFVYPDGRIAFARQFDLDGERLLAPEPEFTAALGRDAELGRHYSPQGKVGGYARIGASAYAWGAAPILRSNGKGPVAGYLVLVTGLDHHLLDYASSALGARVELDLGSRAGAAPVDVNSELTARDMTLLLVDDEHFETRFRLGALDGAHAVGVKITATRMAQKTAQDATHYLLWTTLVFGTLLTVLALGYIERRLLAPLQAANARNAAIVNAIPDELFRIDASGRAFAARAGARGAPADLAARYGPQAARAMSEAAREVRESRVVQLVDFATQGAGDGGRREDRYYEARIAAIDGAQALCVVRDISDRMLSKIAAIEAKEGAEQASRAKSAFLATMSHEIRTPLNGILGMGQLLLMEKVSDAERRDCARTLLDSGQTLLALLNDVLDLSKVEAGKVKLDPAVFDPGRILREIGALFMDSARSKGLLAEFAWRGRDARRYRADPIRLRQMLSNLVSNAIKFSHSGTIRVEASEVDCAQGIAVLEFSVADNGIGIPEDRLPMMFKPFSQADNSITREYGGTGLGLSIVKSLAEMMGGNVGVESEVGRGTRIWFRIRANVVDSGEECRDIERSEEADRAAVDADETFGSVLVVEDNPTNRKVMDALLKKMGIRARMLVNGQEAVHAIEAGARPRMIFMDVQMPVMDGLQATARIRAWEAQASRAQIPIVALTAGAFDEDRANCIAAGMDDYLTKPIDVAALRAALARWMTRSDLPAGCVA
jgi:signal transduction histidine kinase/sensor domain CHASE-containing protein/ActR/RegA family two-component response regulator